MSYRSHLAVEGKVCRKGELAIVKQGTRSAFANICNKEKANPLQVSREGLVVSQGSSDFISQIPFLGGFFCFFFNHTHRK